jgi:hypothetical protein
VNQDAGPVEQRVRRTLVAELARATGEEPSTPAAKSLPEKPIQFNAAMARALAAGQKTQTRRPMRPLPVGAEEVGGLTTPVQASGQPVPCRLAKVGQTLYVREPWAFAEDGRGRVYEADVGPAVAAKRQWQPGRTLPRDASRFLLDVRQVRAEQIQAISESDAKREGMPPGLFDEMPIVWFRRLWDGFYGRSEFAWEQNPWVWVIDFAVRTPGRGG